MEAPGFKHDGRHCALRWLTSFDSSLVRFGFHFPFSSIFFFEKRPASPGVPSHSCVYSSSAVVVASFYRSFSSSVRVRASLFVVTMAFCTCESSLDDHARVQARVIPKNERKCTDLIFLLLFFISFIVVIAILLNASESGGDPNR